MTFPVGPLSRDIGLRAGRLSPPAGAAPAEGAAVFVLGSDAPGDRRKLRVGDSVTVEQHADFLTGTSQVTDLLSVGAGAPTLPAVGAPFLIDTETLHDVTSRPDGTLVRIGPDPDAPLAVAVTSSQGSGDAQTFEATRVAGGSAPTGTVFAAGTPVWVYATGLTPLDSLATPSVAVLLRARAKLRAVREAMPDATWRLSLLVDGEERWSRDLSSADGTGDGSRDQEVSDAAALLLGAASPLGARVGLRLELTGAATEEVDAELPAAYLDPVVLDGSYEPTVYNRQPEPGQANVKVGGPGSYAQDAGLKLRFSVPSIGGPGPDNISVVHTVRLWVGGALAWTNETGAFVDSPGFTTTVTDLDGDVLNGVGARTFQLSTVLDDPLPPNSEVEVRLQVVMVGSTVDQTWSFFTEDLLAPTLLTAQAQDATTVRVVASEDLLAADPTGANDALNPSNWSVALLSTSLADGLPAVTPEVVSVAAVSGSTFDLVLDRELTPGAAYAAVAESLVDLSFSANPVAPPGNSAQFAGFRPPRPPLRSFDLLALLPDVNVSEDATEDLRRFVACLQEVTDLLLAEVDRWPDILDPDVAPRPFLQLMLRDLGNPFNFALSEVDERRLLRVLVPIYQLKGTDPGIINAVRFFVGLEVAVVVPALDDVWTLGVSELGVGTYLGSDDLYDKLSFWIESPVSLTAEQRDRIRKIVEYMKRAETHFRGFVEPEPPPPEPDHWELGLSLLGVETTLH